MPLHAWLAALILITPMHVGAEEDGTPKDGYEVLAQEVRAGFLARLPAASILTPARVAALDPEQGKPAAVETLAKIQAALPAIEAVQRGEAAPEQRREAFAALDLEDDGGLYKKEDAPALTPDAQERLKAEAAELKKKLKTKQLDPEKRDQAAARIREIAARLGVGPAAEDIGGAPVIQAGMVGPADAARRSADYAKTPPGYLHNSLKTQAPAAPASAAPKRPPHVQEVVSAFRDAVGQLDKDGVRRPGRGTVNGVVNNFVSVWGNIFGESDYVRCFDQAEHMQGILEKKGIIFGRDSQFSPRIRTYQRVDEDGFWGWTAPVLNNGHWWMELRPKNEGDPVIQMDPWANELRIEHPDGTIEVIDGSPAKPR